MVAGNEPSDLEPVVAFGARMSWCGLLRPGDAFCPSVRSERVVLVSRTGPPLRRQYGAWSSRYRRFTANLSSPDLTVRAADRSRDLAGVDAILHWVRRSDARESGPGTVCGGDGWPVDLWRRFTKASDRRGPGGVAEQLAEYAASTLDGSEPIVRVWRESLRTDPLAAARPADRRGAGWFPVPAGLEVEGGPTRCLVSWSPSAARFRSVREALDSGDADATPPDLRRQAEYHVEAVLGGLHGVRFGRIDAFRDPEYERTPLVANLLRTYRAREARAVSDPALGRLDRRVAPDRAVRGPPAHHRRA